MPAANDTRHTPRDDQDFAILGPGDVVLESPLFEPPPRELREFLVRVREESVLTDPIGRSFRMEMDWDDTAA